MSKARQLGRDGHHERLLVTPEDTVVQLTDGQRTQWPPQIRDGYTQKGSMRPFSELRQVPKARMGVRVGKVDRALSLYDKAHESFSSCEAHRSDSTRVKTIGRYEDEAGLRRVHEVDRTGIHGHALFDTADNKRQGLIQISRFVEPLREVSECVEHGERIPR